MANRILLGKRGTSDFGLFVSQNNQDVLTSNNPLGFDSRAAESFIVHSYHQGALVPVIQNSSGQQLSRTNTYVTPTQTINQSTATVTHNLGYIPCFALRWANHNRVNSSTGKATTVVPPFDYYKESPETVENDYFEEGDEIVIPGVYANNGIALQSVTTSVISFKNVARRYYDNQNGAETFSTDGAVEDDAFYYWSLVIFTAENFLNGESL